jgi:hypothetical protein
LPELQGVWKGRCVTSVSPSPISTAYGCFHTGSTVSCVSEFYKYLSAWGALLGLCPDHLHGGACSSEHTHCFLSAQRLIPRTSLRERWQVEVLLLQRLHLRPDGGCSRLGGRWTSFRNWSPGPALRKLKGGILCVAARVSRKSGWLTHLPQDSLSVGERRVWAPLKSSRFLLLLRDVGRESGN